MVGIIIPKKVAIGIDFDGTAANSLPELFTIMQKSWPKIRNEEYSISYEDFVAKIRPNITHAQNFYHLSAEFIDGRKCRPDEAKALEDKGIVEYRNARKELMEDMDRYLEMIQPFDGIEDMFREMDYMNVDTFFTSNRERETIRLFLDSIGCEKYVKGVFDIDGFSGRKSQLEHIRSLGYDAKNCALYDDSPKNLDIALYLGMLAIGAPQGYVDNSLLDGYIQAYPKEVPGILRNKLCIEVA